MGKGQKQFWQHGGGDARDVRVFYLWQYGRRMIFKKTNSPVETIENMLDMYVFKPHVNAY